VVAGARDEARLGEYVRQVRRQTLRLVGPLALLLAAAAPLVLRLFGTGYAAGATDTLRLLSLAAIPNVVVALAVSARRVARRMRAVVGIVAGQSGLVIGLSLILLPGSRAAGVGLAWLLASTAGRRPARRRPGSCATSPPTSAPCGRCNGCAALCRTAAGCGAPPR
jgi:O-antigen/teichoic acid export membrane protein